MRPLTRPWALSGLVVLLSTLFMCLISLAGLPERVVVILSDLGQLAAVCGAALACSCTALRSRGSRRQAWWLVAAGTGAWAVGQVVWTYYEVVLRQQVPFPSLADVGFVAFPLLTAAGLVSWLGNDRQLAARGRDLLDGAIIAASLLVLSWVTTLGSVVADGGNAWLPVSLSLAYPIGDLVLATLVLLALSRGDVHERATLLLVGCGLGGLAFADSAYVYLVTIGSYTSGDLITTGWTSGFLLVAAGALTARDGEPAVRAAPVPDTLPTASLWRMTLPYVPLLAASVTLCVRLLTAPVTSRVDLALGIALVTLVLVRQFLAMADNHRLVSELADARDELRHQTLHDPLTGLANRTLLRDRVEHAVTHPGVDVSVLYCDLDDFKEVNDTLGHEAGDDLLRMVAQRLQRCVRPQDTVARLGGDEFAILLENPGDAPQAVADRVVHQVRQPYQLGGTRVHTSVSVGIARHVDRTALPQDTALRLLKDADTAMYASKAAGKGQARLSPATAEPVHPTTRREPAEVT